MVGAVDAVDKARGPQGGGGTFISSSWSDNAKANNNSNIGISKPVRINTVAPILSRRPAKVSTPPTFKNYVLLQLANLL